MCNFKCNSKINKTFFNNVDLSGNVDNIIGKFFGNNIRNYCSCFNNVDITECSMENCNYEDLENEDNFKNICNGCNMKICLDCFNNNKEEMEDLINNNNENENDWLCYDCSGYCENCNEIVDIDCMTGLKNKYGDFKNCCNYCINNNEISFYYDGETFENEDNKVNETDLDGGEQCIGCNWEVEIEEEDCFFVDEKRVVCSSCIDFDLRYI